MARKVLVKVQVALLVNLEDDENHDVIAETIDKMDYQFTYSPNGKNRIADGAEIEYYEVIDNG